MLETKQVTIIGTGLLGASLALALRGKGYAGRIVGVGKVEHVTTAAGGNVEGMILTGQISMVETIEVSIMFD